MRSAGASTDAGTGSGITPAATSHPKRTRRRLFTETGTNERAQRRTQSMASIARSVGTTIRRAGILVWVVRVCQSALAHLK